MKAFIVLVFCAAAALAVEETSNAITLKDLYDSTISFDERIIGGSPASVAQIPFQVAITMHRAAGNSFCGGTLLSNIWVLTAAHCVQGFTSFTIRLGGLTLSATEAGRVQVTATTAIIHPQYNSRNLNNDIALIRLNSAVGFTNRIQPVRLPARGQNIGANTRVRISGWGRTSDANPSVSNILNFVDVTTITNAVCAQTYGTATIIASTLCAVGNPHHSTCNGDSGGPLFTVADGIQHGVVSFVHVNGCASGRPSGYVRTTAFLPWIAQQTGLNV